jgi:pyruvate dehydrogenase E2 component (dihydrolipoamide acetyltransferase)
VSVRGETTIVEPTRAEQAFARRVAESRATVPDLEFGADVEMTAAVGLATEHGCSLTAVLARACALSLRQVPRANAAYRDGRYELYSRINLAVVLGGANAPVAATVFDADQKPLLELGQEIAALADRAAAGQLTSPELTGATATLADFGATEVERPSTVLTPPQAAAIAAGCVRDTPVIREGAIVTGQLMSLTMVVDTRILWGAEAARLLGAIRQSLHSGAL